MTLLLLAARCASQTTAPPSSANDTGSPAAGGEPNLTGDRAEGGWTLLEDGTMEISNFFGASIAPAPLQQVDGPARSTPPHRPQLHAKRLHGTAHFQWDTFAEE